MLRSLRTDRDLGKQFPAILRGFAQVSSGDFEDLGVCAHDFNLQDSAGRDQSFSHSSVGVNKGRTGSALGGSKSSSLAICDLILFVAISDKFS